MKKLSEIKNEDALDVLAEILEPAGELFADKDLRKIFENGGNRTELVKKILKEHKTAIIKIMAALDGIPYEEYECNIITLPLKLLDLFNDEDLLQFFQSQGLTMGDKYSGSATESIAVTEGQ